MLYTNEVKLSEKVGENAFSTLLQLFNSTPDDNIRDLLKMKASAEPQIIVTLRLHIVIEGWKSLWEKVKMQLPVFSSFPIMCSAGWWKKKRNCLFRAVQTLDECLDFVFM